MSHKPPKPEGTGEQSHHWLRDMVVFVVTLTTTFLLISSAAGCHRKDTPEPPPASKGTPAKAAPAPQADVDDPDNLDNDSTLKTKPWKQPVLPRDPHSDWQLVIVDLPEIDSQLTYQVPYDWSLPDKRGRARSSDGLVRAVPTVTPLTKDGPSIQTYVEQLSQGQTIFERTTPRGHKTYITRRKVSVAPTDPNVAQGVFHTVVARSEGRVIKLEISYDTGVRWRFAEIADAIAGTMELRDPDEQ